MSPEEIKIQLFKRPKDVNMSSIARKLNCSPTAVTLVIDRKSVSRRIMLEVASAIEHSPEDVFPEHF